ncbi:MAG: TetR/AcrR family transcriptional regulator [Vulcanimicrobiaceae bacterium]
MAYEVVKTVGGRQYRYRVESYRDAESGKVKNRWTYIGKAELGSAIAPAPRRRKPSSETRERLIEAFLRLVDREPWNHVTPGAIATEAGVAHGTFYRYFKDRRALFAVCSERAIQQLDQRLAELDAVAPTAEEERERLRSWLRELFVHPTAPPGLLRVWADLALGEIREVRHTHRIEAFTRYISRLRERGFVESVGEIRPLAVALSLIMQMITRRSVIEQELLSEDDHAAVMETFDRIIFWRTPNHY